MLTLLSLSLFAVAAPVPAPKTPEGPPPRLMVVQVDEAGRPFLEGMIQKQGMSMVHEVVPVTVQGKDGKPQVQYVTVAKAVPHTYYELVYLDTKEAQVFGLNGKRIDPNEVKKLLTRSTRVLVSTDGKPIARAHLERQREAALWVIHPGLIKAPTPAPAPKP